MSWRPRQLLIFTPGRAGSDCLVTLLDSHPSVVCENELLAEERRAPLAYVRWRAHRASIRHRTPVHGWKLITNHIFWKPRRFPDPGRFVAHFARGGNLLVTLRRTNRVAQALSFLHAERTQYHFAEADEATFEPFEVVPERLLHVLWHFEEMDQRLVDATAGLRSIDLLYEEDVLDMVARERSMERIVEALGLERAELRSDVVAITPRTPADRVTNIDAVRRVLGPTRWHGQIDQRV